MRKASAMAPSTGRSGPRASRLPAAPRARHNSGPIRCSEAAVTARAMSAPPVRARRTAAGSGSRRQASHSSLAVCSVVAGPWPSVGARCNRSGGAKPSVVREAMGTRSAAIASAERGGRARHAAHSPGPPPLLATDVAKFVA